MSPPSLKPNHLVIVCGHGIWLGGPKDGWDESEWLIEDYKAGETPTFIEHIKAGVRVLSQNRRAVLTFSGYVTALLAAAPNITSSLLSPTLGTFLTI
jgi:hypothetical protein